MTEDPWIHISRGRGENDEYIKENKVWSGSFRPTKLYTFLGTAIQLTRAQLQPRAQHNAFYVKRQSGLSQKRVQQSHISRVILNSLFTLLRLAKRYKKQVSLTRSEASLITYRHKTRHWQLKRNQKLRIPANTDRQLNR